MSPPRWGGLAGALPICTHADAAAYVPLVSEAVEVGPQASWAWPLTMADLVAILALPACFPCGTGMAEEGRAPLPPQLILCADRQPCCPHGPFCRGRPVTGGGHQRRKNLYHYKYSDFSHLKSSTDKQHREG